MAETVKHTPGPWEAGVNPKGVYTNEVVVRPAGQFPHGTWIADCGDSVDGTRMANALLISAAPELVDVVREAIPFLETIARNHHPEWRPEMADSDSVLGRAYAAIAKAEGRS